MCYNMGDSVRFDESKVINLRGDIENAMRKL